MMPARYGFLPSISLPLFRSPFTNVNECKINKCHLELRENLLREETFILRKIPWISCDNLGVSNSMQCFCHESANKNLRIENDYIPTNASSLNVPNSAKNVRKIYSL